ncbi:L-rhamnose mutarotase [Cecembia sp.]|uniref:L-rhamnose mutarotase n=1 Tax=Cecembia sp. TaxID=1898110 RepID=UPI0025B9AC1C|nr:L-rhamnose mutarotase [Cecembia sp.]
MKRYCLTLDLIDDALLIKEYESYHQNVWPEILKSFKDSGILSMEIYRWNNRMFMIMETEDDFSFNEKTKADASNPKVQEWEKLMGKYQKKLPGSKEEEKWQLMTQIFKV